jgi:hypothetical protein
MLNYLEDCLWIVSFPPFKYEFVSKSIKNITGIDSEKYMSNPFKWHGLAVCDEIEYSDYQTINSLFGWQLQKVRQNDGTIKMVESNIFVSKNKNKTIWHGISREVKD